MNIPTIATPSWKISTVADHFTKYQRDTQGRILYVANFGIKK